MKHIITTSGLRDELAGREIRLTGLVPTMGALHEGHLSLVKRSAGENSLTIVSIFINPTQFNDAGDLEKYPRKIESDIAMLSPLLKHDDIVFTPEADDIYRDEKVPDINLGHLDSVMEGEHRPGHFRGVIRIVNLLFSICKPDRAYFGRKDFQQVAVIKTLVKQAGLNTEIISCPIVREDNGLAMSSRNERLSPELRNKAGIIYKTLRKYSNLTEYQDIDKIKKTVAGEINESGNFRVEYFEIVDDDELKPLRSVTETDGRKKYTGCIAVYAGDVRLIDNTEFYFPFTKG